MIVTLTMNPAIDISTSVDEVAPYRKLRCAEIRRDPGGGGINVARVARRFGADVTAIYPRGGTMGTFLQQLVDAEGILSHAIPVGEDTREDFTAFERQTGQEYRFVLPGPRLGEGEWQKCLDAVTAAPDSRFLVISGSLPPGVPEDFYVRVARNARRRDTQVAVDTSGAALRVLLADGVFLAKPNRRELQEYAHEALEDETSQLAAARALVAHGHAEIVALTLGDRGGLLVTKDGAWRATAPKVNVLSTVGAGDSFLGAMVVRLDRGHDLLDAFRHGIAAGSSALMYPGTELCRLEDVERLLPQVRIEELAPKRRPRAALA